MMMSSEMKEASALGGRTARACESCLKVRARWYCAADDAFLCQGCDNMVHSANQLASRHQRVKLQTASSKVNYSLIPTTHHNNNKVAWHSGFTRKARTPRHNKHSSVQQQQQQQKPLLHEEGVFFNNTMSLPLVPELGSEEEPLLINDIETEEQLMCRVPVFDAAELCSIYKFNDEVKDKVVVAAGEELAFDLENFSSEFLPSDTDLAEFAADVESLLGNGPDEDSPENVKGSELLLLDCKEEYGDDEMVDALCVNGAKEATLVKVKDEEEIDVDDTACHLDSFLNWNIGESEESPTQEENKVSQVGSNNKQDMFLRLNYEEVISAWASQGCPWTTGTPPKFNSHEYCWPDFLGWSGGECCYGEVRSIRVHADAGGREARVSRYREKRRTRLFAKKIRI